MLTPEDCAQVCRLIDLGTIAKIASASGPASADAIRAHSEALKEKVRLVAFWAEPIEAPRAQDEHHDERDAIHAHGRGHAALSRGASDYFAPA